MEIKPEFKNKSIRSFVIRAGRITEGQKLAFESWWPKFGMSLHAGKFNSSDAFLNENPLVVEVGFGMGDSLLQMTQAEPEKNFLGIEVHPPGVGRIINSAGRLDVNNLKVYMADATDVLRDCIEDNAISRFQLYFPDPWHKKKHHKRRIVQPEFIQLVVDKMQVGGVLHMATDWENYAEYMLEVLSGNSHLSNTVIDFAERPNYRPITKFEKRGAGLGHGVWDLIFTKVASR